MTETTKIKIELWLTFDEIELVHKTLKENNEKILYEQFVRRPRGAKRTTGLTIDALINECSTNDLKIGSGDKLFPK
jgi:hypothetical protein